MADASTEALVAAILNAAWAVRHYTRGANHRTSSHIALLREQAIQHLGLTVRDAFIKSDSYELLLTAVVEGLRPKEEDPPF